MKPAYLFVFDGYADWEPALACAELARNGTPVVSFGVTREAVRTMANLRVTPDRSLPEVDVADASILILPGADAWEIQERKEITSLIRRAFSTGVPVAAICGATIAAAHSGVLNDRRHTSNFPGYIGRFVQGYDSTHYSTASSAITDSGLITASGMGSVEFAYEILKLLRIYSEDDLQLWSGIFKDKKVPDDLIR